MSNYERDIHSIAKSLENIDKALWALYSEIRKENLKDEQQIKNNAEKEPELQEDLIHL